MVSFRSHLAVSGVNARVRELPGRGVFIAARVLRLLLCCGGVLAGLHSGRCAETNSLLGAWLNSQTNIQTWSADVAQTRSFKSLSQPLTASGRVWFAAPNRFRWELGHPPQTIALRQPEQMWVIYPRLKRAEKYPLTGDHPGPWRDTLALLEAGFPRSRSELESRFRILSETSAGGRYEIALQPRSASARRMMPLITVAFGTNDLSLRATELQFADGSTMRNEFTGTVLNAKFDETKFDPQLDPDFKIVEPLSAK